jgi:exodeoxyribonuclease VII small subunit
MARKPKPDRKQDQPEAPSFEAALARLEQIAARLESEDLSLEEAIALAEEGQRLLLVCEKQLTAAETRIHQLVEKAGELTVEPLEAEETEDDSGQG